MALKQKHQGTNIGLFHLEIRPNSLLDKFNLAVRRDKCLEQFLKLRHDIFIRRGGQKRVSGRFSNGLGTADSSAHHGAALSWAVPSSKMVSPAHPQIFSFHYPDFISILFLMQRISPFSVMLCLASVSITVCTKMQTQWEEGLARHTSGHSQVSERQVTHAGSPIQHSARLPDSWKSCKRKK